MDSHHPDRELIEKRQAAYQAAWQSQSIEQVMSFMADSVSISDFAFGIHNLDRTAAQAFFTKIFAGTENINMNTRSISGHKYFTAWEWEVTFNYIKPVEEVAHEEGFEPDKADGRRMRLVAVDLLWWNDDGKIVKDHTYSKMILV